MFRIDPLYLATALLIILGVLYLAWMDWDRKHLKQMLHDQQTAAHIQAEKDHATIWSQEQLIKIKTKDGQDAKIDTTPGVHTLQF